jgi:hypothetical protein
MNTAAYMRSAVLEALEQYGFKDGKYGDVPFHLLAAYLSIAQTDYSAKYFIMADSHSMGEVLVEIDGNIVINLRLAQWLNPKSAPEFTIDQSKWVGAMPIRKDVKVPLDKLVVAKLDHGW